MWLAQVTGRTVHDPYALYAGQRDTSLERAARALGLAALSAPGTA